MSRALADKLGDGLSALAEQIVESAKGDDVRLDTKIEALKVAGAFYINKKRAKIVDEENPEDDGSFGALKRRARGKEG